MDPHLSFAVDAHDSGSGFVGCSDEYCVSGNAVHVNAHAGLYVIQMNVSILGDQVDDVVLMANLQNVHKRLRYFQE